MTRPVALLLILAAPFAACLAEGVEDEILEAERSWAAGVAAEEYDSVSGMLDDGLIYAHSTGSIERKDEYLGKLRSGAQRYTAINHEKTTVRVHGGDAAVAHSIVVMKGTNAAGPFNNRLMMIHTWVKPNGRWLLAAHQTTLLEELTD